MKKLTDRIALITGGGRGIGRAIALAFSQEGATVAVAARTTGEVKRVADEIGQAGAAQALAVSCDVSDASGVARMFEEVTARLGRAPDILVNNAGIAESAPLVKTTDEFWQ